MANWVQTAALAAGLVVSASVWAQEASLHDRREAAMKEMGGALAAIGKYAKGEREWDDSLAAAAALAHGNATRILDMFPPDGKPEHRAKAEIWTEREAFEKAAGETVAATGELLKVVDGKDREVIGAKLRAVGGTCGTCHDRFRTEEHAH